MTTCPQSKLFNNQFENMEKRFTRIEERTEASFKDLQWSIKNIETLLNKSVTEQKVFNENVVLKKDLKETVQEMKQNNENVDLQLNNTLVQIEETNTRQESKTATALTTLSTTWESKQKESVESFSTMLENYGTKTEFTDLNNTSMKEIKVLKEFVR